MFLAENFAIAIRDYWQDALKQQVPYITRMSVRPSGAVGGGFYLEIGLLKPLPAAQQAVLDGLIVAGTLDGPAALGAPGPVTVKFVTTGSMRLLTYTWTGDVEPVRGGHKVAHISDPYGTLGCLVRLRRNGTLDSANVFFLSCWHVLSGPGILPGAVLEWPRPAGGGFSKSLGNLYWSRVDNRFDVALGLVDAPQAQIGNGFAWSRIGAYPNTPAAPLNAPASVLVCGNNSQKSGTLQSTSATTWVSIPGASQQHMFTDQIQTDSICVPGDSGAILFLDANTAPIGLACCNNVVYEDADVAFCTFFNKLDPLFATQFASEPNSLSDATFQIDSIIGERFVKRRLGPLKFVRVRPVGPPT